jgi:glucose-6-phosphate 1-dehydrogenase
MLGEEMVGEEVELIARHHVGDELPPYARLLSDALRGDTTLFTREDAVEAAWRVVDPILSQATPIYPYAPNSWGPAAADAMMQSLCGWYNPSAMGTL